METLGDMPINLVLLSQRLNFPAIGRRGGKDGSVERLLLNGKPVQGTEPFNVRGGNIFTLELPGGGGFGDPNQRLIDLPAASADDRQD